MKKNTILSFAACALLIPAAGFASPTTGSTQGKAVTVLPDYTFTPKAFDTNDNSQIVLHGTFHEVCARLAPSSYTVDIAQKKIVVRNQAYTTPNCISIFVNTPYTSVINLGVLPAGTYKVYAADVNGSEKYMEVLPVTEAQNPTQTDNYYYAQVEELNTVKASKAHTQTIVLKGVITNSCLSIKEVKTNLTAGNVYDVLPIMAGTGGNCRTIHQPFEKQVELPNFPDAPTLINVRSMGGQSIERVIDKTGIIE
jgi:hypothetical protein